LQTPVSKKKSHACLRQDGFEITQNRSLADYQLMIEANTTEGSERNNRFSTSLRAGFLVRDKADKTLFNKTIGDVSGLGANYSAAGEDAYRSLLGKYRINIYPDIIQTLF
jgi:hypothetical protein